MEPFLGETPAEIYVESLERAGLADSELVQRWRALSGAAYRHPAEVELPVQESGLFEASEPTALSYRFQLTRGEQLRVDLTFASTAPAASATPDADSIPIFLELHRLREPGDSLDPRPLRVASPPPGTGELVHDARATADYVLWIQPELFVEGDFVLELRKGASLAFPVEGRGTGDIQSVFGDARDGGARDHHGVDIFSSRGTPVLAASAGRVSRVRETPIGGKVVWLRDEDQDISQYYAHLDSQLVRSGVHVAPGDTLGFVGNTGNAVTTPPHLHFGIYARGAGPVDPWPYLYQPTGQPARLTVDPELFRAYGVPAAPEVRLHRGPSSTASLLHPFTRSGAAGSPPDPTLHVLAGSGDWLRVRRPDGAHGYLRMVDFETLAQPDHSGSGVSGGQIGSSPLDAPRRSDDF